MTDIIKTENLTFSYPAEEGKEAVPALLGVDLTVERGSFVVVLGHNGSGKSTLAKHLNGVLLPEGGKVWVSGMDTSDESLLLEVRRRVGMVFQNPDNQIIGQVVEEDVGFGPENIGVPTEEIWRRVDESLETNIEGVFACGNVLHVHDLVDFVSEEAKAAGKNAAKYVQEKKAAGGDNRKIRLAAGEGVRYTVPETICVKRMDERLTVRFRVGSVYKDCYVSVYFGKDRIIHKKKAVAAPGEMEEVVLTKEQLMEYPTLEAIHVKIEEA